VHVISIFFYLLLLFYLTIVLFFIYGWLKSKKYIAKKEQYTTTLTVVVAVRNEEANIINLLNDLKSQSYSSNLFDVIIVDDHSTDNTVQLIEDYDMANLRLIKLNLDKPINSYKKKAIKEAIKLSNAKLIVSTDGDCRLNIDWLNTIVAFYEANNFKVISAPVTFHNQQNLFEIFQTIEFQYLIGLGAAAIFNNYPITCNGANFIYEREVFNELDGFKGIDHKATGDDELFLHKVFTKYPNSAGFIKSEQAVVKTYAKHNLKEFIQQRKRWASKSTGYTDKKVVSIVIGVFLFNLALFLSPVIYFFDTRFIEFFSVAIILKVLFDGYFMYLILKFFNNTRFIVYLPLIVLLHVFYILYIGILGNINKTYHWKGRKVY
jgi:cellulose synthase/poly-beta-1,6-N-acetylglucosamine synthase-like glycosyltransferase